VPTKSGGIWYRSGVQVILTNPAYTGKTYAFTKVPGQRQFTRPKEDWIEIPGVTPAIISQELFDAAQKQLQINREKSLRNCKHEYLLRGHLRCRQCGRGYVGEFSNGRYYKCAGRKSAYAPVERCRNKGWKAEVLEGMVWDEIERYLSKPELIISQLETRRQDTDQPGVFETELRQVERQLKIIDRQQRQLLQWAVKEEFSPEQVETENKRLKQVCEALKARKAELETKLKASQEAAVDIPELEEFIKYVQSRISNLGFEDRRQALDMLGITVWLDGENVEITGTIEPSIVTIPS